MSEVNQNAENIKLVEEAIKQAELKTQAEKVNMGENLRDGADIDFESSDGNKYVGKVIFKRPNMLDYMRMGALKSEILRNAGVRDLNLVDKSVQFMSHVMATLKVVIVKSPSWLVDIDKVEEPEVLYHVYAKFEEFEDTFRKTNE